LYRDAAEMLDGQERLEFYEAVIAFALDGTEPDFADKTKVTLFGLVRKEIERGLSGYENSRKKGPKKKGKKKAKKKEKKKEAKKKRIKKRKKKLKKKISHILWEEYVKSNPNPWEGLGVRGKGREIFRAKEKKPGTNGLKTGQRNWRR